MRRIWREALSAVTPYEAGKSLEALEKEMGLEAILRLSSNESPLGPSPAVVEALRREASRAHLYPDGGSTALREAIGRRLGVPPGWIIAGNGGDEILALIARAAFEPGDEILMPHPAFEPYDIEARLSGATPVRSPLKGYDTDLDDMLARVTPRTKTVFLCTPHNPATTIIRRGPLERFLAALGDDPPLVVLDEAYRDFCDDPETADGVPLPAALPAAPLAPHLLEDRGAGGAAGGLCGGAAGGHRLAGPRARALQRQPLRPGRGRGGARGCRASRADARAHPRRAPEAPR